MGMWPSTHPFSYRLQFVAFSYLFIIVFATIRYNRLTVPIVFATLLRYTVTGHCRFTFGFTNSIANVFSKLVRCQSGLLTLTTTNTFRDMKGWGIFTSCAKRYNQEMYGRMELSLSMITWKLSMTTVLQCTVWQIGNDFDSLANSSLPACFQLNWLLCFWCLYYNLMSFNKILDTFLLIYKARSLLLLLL